MCGFLVFEGSTTSKEIMEKGLDKIHHRGPDHTNFYDTNFASFGFKRLSIMDLSSKGNQPFVFEKKVAVCNGEIYNEQDLKKLTKYRYQSDSDCEVLIPMFEKFGLVKMTQLLDGEFSFVLWDGEKLLAGRDPIGIRPMFYGTQKSTGLLAFGSEIKALQETCTDIKAFPPGHVWDGEKFVCYHDSTKVEKVITDMDKALKGIKDHLVEGVRKRLTSDAPVGYLLSGGLDSSLVCAIAQRYSKEPIKTFAIGMDTDAIDLKYAKIVADHIGSDHTEVIITKEDVIKAIREVIYHLETYDITTIRASVGMYLICKHIQEKTDTKVLLTGEVSDEIFGYKYTDFAPSEDAFQQEAEKRVRELYMYDVLRADRCISAHSLEARVPFSDKDFVKHVMSIDPKLKMNFTGKGKFLLREAFKEGDWLPEEILWREKAAFSDAVGHSMVDYIKAYAEELYEAKELESARFKYKHATPFTKESLMFRDIFEEFYPGKSYHVADFWMPNKEWEGCDVDDPSARVLSNYGASGV